MPRDFFARKPVSAFTADLEEGSGRSLKRALGPIDLTLLGIGGIIGTGIFVLTGVAARQDAGPAVVASFALAGLVSALAAFCYAEFSTMLPISGSAYSYSYATLGELFAWIIGWDLVIEYAVAASTVASGWSGYFGKILGQLGIHIPVAFSTGFLAGHGGFLNVPALLIILAVSSLLVIGVRESTHFNSIIVVLKTAVILYVIAAGAGYVDTSNWNPFMPFGWHGVVAGAGLVFFAYIGFDGVTTAAEEARNPERDMPIGIIGSLAICTALYIAVAAVITGMVPLSKIDVTAPLAQAFLDVGLNLGASLISAGAIIGLTSVLLVLLYGQSRIFFAMSRDGLLPPMFSRLHPRYRTPHLSTMLVGVLVAFVAAIFPLDELARFVSIGTLAAFVMVSAGVIVLRRTEPDMHRPFRCPFVPALPIACILACLYLMIGLGLVTWLRLGIWMAIGLVIYFAYGSRHSRIAAVARARG
ncbi:MAG TPA: amino acid permease [Myxococcota bacterium]|nr:amino acid permease [Myxococcota bacterium]